MPEELQAAQSEVTAPTPAETTVAEVTTESATEPAVKEEVKQVEQPETPKAEEPAKVEGEAKEDAEVKPEDIKVEPPVYEDFTLPEGINLEEDGLRNFKDELAGFQTELGLDTESMQKFGQKLVDRYVAETQKTIQLIQEDNLKKYDELTTGWKDSFMSDPEIGGKRSDTTISQAQRALDRAFEMTEDGAKAKEQLADFRQLMNDTGVGNHPQMLRALSNLMKIIDGYETESAKPLPASRSATKALSKLERRYGKSN